MTKMLRALGMVLLAASTVAAPCAPALVFSAGCQMPPCEEGSTAGVVGSSSCCCATPGTPSDTAQASASLLASAKVAPSDCQIPEAPELLEGRHAEAAALAPASSCYIQHHSLLM